MAHGTTGIKHVPRCELGPALRIRRTSEPPSTHRPAQLHPTLSAAPATPPTDAPTFTSRPHQQAAHHSAHRLVAAATVHRPAQLLRAPTADTAPTAHSPLWLWRPFPSPRCRPNLVLPKHHRRRRPSARRQLTQPAEQPLTHATASAGAGGLRVLGGRCCR